MQSLTDDFCGGVRSHIAVDYGTMDGVYETLSRVGWERSVQFWCGPPFSCRMGSVTLLWFASYVLSFCLLNISIYIRLESSPNHIRIHLH